MLLISMRAPERKNKGGLFGHPECRQGLSC